MSTSNREVVQELQEILRVWEEDNAVTTRDPTPHLIKLCELFERETINFMKKDPDPFDDRHPATSEPECALGQILRVLFKKEAFVNKLVGNYLRENYFSSQGVQQDATELNTAACRLLLDLLHGFDIPHVFNESETTVTRFFTWAEKGPEPLRTYATGLLAAAMDIPEIAASFRDQNAHLVPIMLKRLWDLKDEKPKEYHSSGPNSGIVSAANSTPSEAVGSEEKVPERPFALFNKKLDGHNELENGEVESSNIDNEEEGPARKKLKESPPECETPTKNRTSSGTFNIFGSPKANRDLFDPSLNSDCSNSSWAEMSGYIMGTYQMYPINKDAQQMFILKYLRPVGEYQESLGHVYEHNALELIFHYINVRKTGNARLSFEALRFLGSLLFHKKFCLEFVKMGGMQKLLAVPRPSLPADGVALCLWYLAYCEEAVERICLLTDQMLSELVRYTLWLLECSHQSSRQHAVMFFGMVFRFRAMLDRFDEQDGLRKMLNMLSTLSLFQDVWEQDLLDEPNEVIMWHTVKQVCLSVKNYFEAHLTHKVQNLQRTRTQPQGSVPQQTPLAYKAVNVTSEVIERNVEYLLENIPFRSRWKPVEQFVSLKGMPLFLQLVAMIINDSHTQNRAETAVYALETLYVCTVMPPIQLALCDKLTLPPGDDLLQTLDPQEVPGYAILVACIHENTQSVQSTPEIQKSALSVLINCLCAPIHKSASGSTIRSSTSSSSSSKKSKSGISGEELINKSWDCVRTSNGIMYLLNVLNKKVPITDADCIRGLACHALVGLSRSDTARQIMSKLPMFTSGQLQLLMKEPILQDKRIEHVKFQRHALELIKAVSGRIKQKGDASMDISIQSIHKADVVAQTRINYNKRQLLQLIQVHLNHEGYDSIATALQQVANLPSIPLPHALMGPPTRNMATPPPSSRHRINSQRSLFSPAAVSKNALSNLTNGSLANMHTDSPSPPPVNSPSSTPIHIKINRKSKRESLPTSSLNASYNNLSNSSSINNLSKTESSLCATTSVPGITGNIGSPYVNNLCSSDPSISLDRIVTEYLMNQHALCKNPVVTCPTFDLFQPHSCPEPRSQRAAPTNFTMRHARKFYGINGSDTGTLNRKYIYSRYRPTQVYRQADDDDIFVCCEFTPDDQFIVAGTTRGDVRLFSKNGATEEGVYTVHQGAVSSLVPHNSGNLLLTSCTAIHETSLWSITDMFEFKFSLEECHHADFNNAQDKIIGTSDPTARLYDLNTSNIVCEFSPKLSNHYRINKAVLDPTDTLILTDGVMFDVRTGKQIHKFDKINPTLNGIFHRNGLEILSSSEIWDLRTFHLLRTVPSLNLCDVIFNHSSDVIFGVTVGDDQQDNAYETSFKTVDASDYSSIVTFDVRRVVSSLAINRTDTQIAIVETETGSDDLSEDAVVRLYEIGMTRQEDDELVDEDEEEIGSDDDSDDSDDDAPNSQNDGGLLGAWFELGGSGAENDDDDDNSSSISNVSIQSFEEDLEDGSDDDAILFELNGDNSNSNSNAGADPLENWLQNNQVEDDDDDDQDYDQGDDDDGEDDDDNDDDLL